MARTRSRKGRRKPSKPYPSFPLTAHNNGQWCKKVRGKVHFFGVWEDADSALQNYLSVAQDLHEGRQPSPINIPAQDTIVKEACNHYLTYQARRAELGEISAQWCEDCKRTVRDLARFLGPARLVSDLRPGDFEAYRQKLRRCGLSGNSPLGPYALDRSITVAKAVFAHAYEMELIDRPMRFGKAFARSSAAEKRRARGESVRRNGRKLLEPTAIRRILGTASVPMRAMVLLGINAGFGNADCGRLPLAAIDHAEGVIEFPRHKTGVERVVPLWPETATALTEAVAARPEPTCAQAMELAFVTVFGRPWVRCLRDGKGSRTDAVGQEFNKLLTRLALKRAGIGFYALRHTFRTWADETRDQHAVHRIMGHAIPGMSGIYIEEISLDRLRAVTDHVRMKLFGRGG